MQQNENSSTSVPSTKAGKAQATTVPDPGPVRVLTTIIGCHRASASETETRPSFKFSCSFFCDRYISVRRPAS
eukprot:795188-Rhodomonas_salina.2